MRDRTFETIDLKEQGYGVDYQYPHNHEGVVVAANYFPIGIQPQNFYEPSDRGFEGEVRERLSKVKVKMRAASVAKV